MAKTVELFGSTSCAYTQELREWLDWTGCEYVERDVERDESAMRRLKDMTGGQTAIPVLIEDDKVVQVGWQGRTCVLAK